jgi:hypothetical protein
MSVRYNPAIGVVLIVLGAVNVVLALWLFQVSGSGGFSLIIGPVIVIIGILQLTRSYFEYLPSNDTIAMKALIGPARREFSRLSVDGNRILHTRADGRTKKVPVNRFFARGGEWQAVVTRIGSSPRDLG